jgi:hypothetical protein
MKKKVTKPKKQITGSYLQRRRLLTKIQPRIPLLQLPQQLPSIVMVRWLVLKDGILRTSKRTLCCFGHTITPSLLLEELIEDMG